MIFHVRRRYRLAFAIAAVLVGVAVLIPYLLEGSATCPPIGIATRVIISTTGTIAAPDRAVTDPERIRQLTAFANARRKCSWSGLDVPASPRTEAVFYDKDDFLGAIGSGSNFFSVRCSSWSGTRHATDVELRDSSG